MTEVLDPPATTLGAGLGSLRSALDELASVTASAHGPGSGGLLWQSRGSELLDAAAELHELACRAEAVLHAVVHEIDVRGAAVEAGAATTAAWLRWRLRLHPGAARRMVASARWLHDDPAGPLVHHEASDQPGAETSVAEGLRDDGSAAAASATEDPLASPRGARRRWREAFAVGAVSGEHVSVTAATVARLAPTIDPAVVGRAECYLADQARVHDPLALARLGRHLRHVLDLDGLADEERADRFEQSLDIHRRRDGGCVIRGRLGVELTAELLSALSPLAAPRPDADGARDTRASGQRNADALAELLRRCAVSGATPERHGSRASITVTMALETLQRRLGSLGASLDWSGPISADTARRLACDASVIPVVLGSAGQPLDVGRASYPVTQAIWRALVARDGGCAFAGCDRPPEWTEAHHRRHWADGGETSVENCCLLCDHHHRKVHDHGWQVVLTDGQIHTIPPPWVDPRQVPRRNTARTGVHELAGIRPEPHDRR